jgi:hypothetical protein
MTEKVRGSAGEVRLEIPIVTGTTEEEIKITRHLQRQCLGSYLEVVSNLATGLSEAEIAQGLRDNLEQRGVKDYWYTVPIIILIGPDRFMTLGGKSYEDKSPKEDVYLKEGDPVFVDIQPRDERTGIWGDFSATVIYKPSSSDQVNFLQEMLDLRNEAIAGITSDTTPAQLAKVYSERFKSARIALVDSSDCFGHIMNRGEKSNWSRLFVDGNHPIPTMSHGIWAIEPGGYKDTSSGRLVARFETCIKVLESGKVVDLTGSSRLPLFV